NGFFDQILFVTPQLGLVLGDPALGSQRNPVEGSYFAFRIRVTNDGGTTWAPVTDPESGKPGVNLLPLAGEGLFAASNSSAVIREATLWIGTGGGRILKRELHPIPKYLANSSVAQVCAGNVDPISKSSWIPW